MGETIMHDLICNEIAEKQKKKTNLVHILTTYLFRELDKSLLCVKRKSGNDLDTSVDNWHDIYSMCCV
jgi:hypothetical protein